MNWSIWNVCNADWLTGSSRGTSGRSLGGSTSQSSEGEGGIMMGINMAEWDTGPHREMAVDVPDSFVARTKTPPRYPPPKHEAAASSAAAAAAAAAASSATSPAALRKKATVSAAAASSNGVKPVLPSREHLRIEEDGRLVNRAVPPQVAHPLSFAYDTSVGFQPNPRLTIG